ncbi:hypothetical protein FACS189434_04140 [Bacteroidia bacterium]|nr:hypothetical protein FACS189434_04140 [Bacteroidia bacterium]
MAMKIKRLTLGLFFFILMNSCIDSFYERHYAYEIHNNSKYTTQVYIAVSSNGGVYPDTTLSFVKDRITTTINPFSQFNSDYGSSFEEIFSHFPNDTLSIYIFDRDTLNKYFWEEIQRDYKILQRYDLSFKDIQILQNKYGIPEIPYPPDERMKEMKMYPPYGN